MDFMRLSVALKISGTDGRDKGYRIETQLVMIVQILVAEGNTVDPPTASVRISYSIRFRRRWSKKAHRDECRSTPVCYGVLFLQQSDDLLFHEPRGSAHLRNRLGLSPDTRSLSSRYNS